jgi:hypothetical protein
MEYAPGREMVCAVRGGCCWELPPPPPDGGTVVYVVVTTRLPPLDVLLLPARTFDPRTTVCVRDAVGAVAEAVWRLFRDAEPLPRFPGYDDLDEEELLFPMVLILLVFVCVCV